MLTALASPLLVGYDFSSALGQQNWSTYVRTATLAPTLTVDFGHKWTAQVQAGWAFETVAQEGRNFVNFDALSIALDSTDTSQSCDPFSNPTRTCSAVIDRVRATTHYDSDSQVRWASSRFTGPVATRPGGETQVTVGGEFRDQILNQHAGRGARPVDGRRSPDSGVARAGLLCRSSYEAADGISRRTMGRRRVSRRRFIW
jgi:hypothetical protein